jgi:hypothetical protein
VKEREVNPDEMPWRVVLTIPVPTEATAKFLQARIADDWIEQGNGVTVKIEVGGGAARVRAGKDAG